MTPFIATIAVPHRKNGAIKSKGAKGDWLVILSCMRSCLLSTLGINPIYFFTILYIDCTKILLYVKHTIQKILLDKKPLVKSLI